MRFVFLTIDGTHATALREAAAQLRHTHTIGLDLAIYTAPTLRSEADWQRLRHDVARADFVFGARLFGEDLVRPLQGILAEARCPVCVITSNPALIHCTRLGKFILQEKDDGRTPNMLQQWIRKLRSKGGASEAKRQLALLRNLSSVLKLIPGKTRDLHTYIVAHQYWLNNAPENIRRLLCLLIERYVPGYKGRLPVQDPVIFPDVALFHPDAPAPFEDLEAYRKWRAERAKATRQSGAKKQKAKPSDPSLAHGDSVGSVGLLTLRTVALSGNTAHLTALVHALEARGIEVRLAYASGLDMRPAIEKFFLSDDTSSKRPDKRAPSNPASADAGRSASVDVLINGTGFALVGGPAESRPDDARAILEQLDIGYLDLIPLSFQCVEEWRGDDSGLAPIQVALNVAIPELDGATEPCIFGGIQLGDDTFVALPDQVDLLAKRITRRIGLRRKSNAEKKIAIAIFSFPPTLGNIGTAAYLDVFASLYRLLAELAAEGYNVEMPESVEALQQAILGTGNDQDGSAMLHGTDGNVAARLSVTDYRQLFPAYVDIEPYWGSAPGELLNDGKSFYILGRQFGNIFVGIQPSFGYERDPMRLLMAKDAAPHHGFAAFYTWIDKVFGADAMVHFGTHGALEFMPGKQVGLSSKCWPTQLLGNLPNFYYYSVNNPSEATIAKRRSAATTISYLVPPLQQAGLYKGLRLLKDNLESYRQRPDPALLEDIRVQAEKLGLHVDAASASNDHAPAAAELSDEVYIAALNHELLQTEQRMIPAGLHVLGQPPTKGELIDFLALVTAFKEVSSEPEKARRRSQDAAAAAPSTLPQLVATRLGWNYEDLRAQIKHDRTAQERWEHIDRIVHEAMKRFVEANGATPQSPYASLNAQLERDANIPAGSIDPLWRFLTDLTERLTADGEVRGLLHALHGGYTPPSPGNDVVRNPAVVPTGRNIHALDPYRVPSAVALVNGARLMAEMLERLTREQNALPETVALVLWGTDNLKSDCEGVAQVLALLGARTVTDELGNVSGVTLIPLAELGRPRIDVVVTVSGIFRDLFTHQMNLLDQAVKLAAVADEPSEFNFVRKHALAQAAELGVSLEEAATRVFANAPGSYGANVNNLVESSTWDNADQLSDAFLSRKSFSASKSGEWRETRAIMERALATVDASFQNIDSFEVGISDINNYYENLGGITKSVEMLRGKRPPVLVADAVSTGDRLSSLEQMVRLETRAKLLNPKWYESMLAHGFQGAREIEARVNNTYGWSATAGAVEDWVYQGVADTFLLDEAMRKRMAQLNPHATAAMAGRLLEANSRGFWEADESTLESLRDIYSDLEDRLEGIGDAVEVG
jgi:magnesium chelatase subunit H